MLVPRGQRGGAGKEPWQDQLDSAELKVSLSCDPGQVPSPLLSLSFLTCKVGQ